MAAALLLVCSLLFAGYAARRLGRFPDNAAEVLNRFIIDICVPATILWLVPKLTVSPKLAVLVVVPWTMAALAYVLARVAKRLLGLDSHDTTALFLATALGNTSFLGFPLCGALLGQSSIPLAAVYDQLGSFLLLSTVAPLALAKVSAGARPTPRQLAARVLLFPPFIALLLALLPLPRPAALEPVLAGSSCASLRPDPRRSWPSALASSSWCFRAPRGSWREAWARRVSCSRLRSWSPRCRR
jgi:malate permease and related proteins